MLPYQIASQRYQWPNMAGDSDLTGAGSTCGQHSGTPTMLDPTIGARTSAMRQVRKAGRMYLRAIFNRSRLEIGGANFKLQNSKSKGLEACPERSRRVGALFA